MCPRFNNASIININDFVRIFYRTKPMSYNHYSKIFIKIYQIT